MNIPTCHNVPGFSGLYLPLQGNVFMCPRIKDNLCQLLRLPPSWMKGNHKLKPVCFQKYNLCLINMKFKGTAEYTSPAPKKNTLENRRFNSNALCGTVAAPLRHTHLLNFKHIKRIFFHWGLESHSRAERGLNT